MARICCNQDRFYPESAKSTDERRANGERTSSFIEERQTQGVLLQGHSDLEYLLLVEPPQRHEDRIMMIRFNRSRGSHRLGSLRRGPVLCAYVPTRCR